jgi:curli biogenesis system outer membrane secretion channel CsgG
MGYFSYFGVGTTTLLVSLGVAFYEPAFGQAQNPASGLTPALRQSILQRDSIVESKPRIAILDLDFSSVSLPFFTVEEATRGVSDRLTNKLVQSGKYTVIERSRVIDVLKEQDFGASGRVDATTAASIGRILGVEAVIVGSVNQFDVEEKKGGFVLFGIGSANKDVIANIKISVRVVSTNTSEILMVAEGNGNAVQKDDTVVVGGFATSSETSNVGKLFSDATEKAIDQIVNTLNSSFGSIAALPRVSPNVDAAIADVQSQTVIINKGSAHGMQVGMQLSVERNARVIKDPQTGQVLRKVTEPIATLEITEVDGNSSVARIVSLRPKSKLQVGDTAKTAQ